MIRYKQPKRAIYLDDINVYDLKVGWLKEERETVVIGEDKYCYITAFKESKIGYWDQLGKYETWFTSSIGFSKDRLVKWLPTQMKLF